MTTLKTVTIAAVLLAGGTSLAMAQYGYPGYGYGYGYAGTPLYGYAGYGAPATAGTTIVIVTPGAPAYTAPPVVGYNYAPGYWGGYGRWRAGYWGGYGYGW
jgi:hypothetical protein